MSHSFRNTCVRAVITCSVLLASQAAIADVTPDPGDYTGLPPGTDLFVMYYQNPRSDDVYVNRNKVLDNFGLRVDVGLLRYVHFMQWGDFIIDPQIIQPFVRQKIGSMGVNNSGVGDTIFGGTLWTKADLKTGEHLGFSLFITAPTGDDKISADRWAVDLQTGYIRKLADKWTMDLVAEVEFYGDQRTTNAKTDPLLKGIAHLRYHLSDATHIAASYRHAWGAEQENNGVKSGRKNDDNVTLTWASFIAKQWQLQLQYQQDLRVENGPKLDGVQARLLYAF